MLSLGIGGSIVIRTGYEIIDGEGPDFVVFENTLCAGGGNYCWIEAAIVEAHTQPSTTLLE